MEALRFIAENVLARLKDGSFVPERRSKPGDIRIADRRDTLSPLAITKRCIRYEPYVFRNRKNTILQVAESLNQPKKKLILVTGSSGVGKTSVARGIVELMGGGPEQLLWFDINLHTDFDEISRFLIQYIAYISEALGVQTDQKAIPDDPELDPFVRLEYHLNQVAHLPLLLVIDNLEFIINPEYRIQSYSFKEFMNFLLSFPNVKMLLIGERLPHADISVDLESVEEVKVAPLKETESLPLVFGSQPAPDFETFRGAFHEIFRKSGGAPWVLRAIGTLLQEGHPLEELAETLHQPGLTTSDLLARLIYEELSLEEQGIAQILSLLRHPVDLKSLVAITRIAKPELSHLSFSQLEQTLSQSLLRLISRRNFPPQRVLTQIRKRLDLDPNASPIPPQPWYECYRPIKKTLYHILPEEERLLLHQHLQEFYLKEKNRDLNQRVYRVKSKFLLGEATFHGNIARKRRSVEQVESSLESKSYFYKGLNPIPGEKILTLEDYRQIKLPDAGIEEEKTISEFVFRDASEAATPERLERLNLTEEEQRLLAPNTGPSPPFLAEPATIPVEIEAAPSPEIPEEEHAPEYIDNRERQIQHRLAAAVASQNKAEMLHLLLELAHYRASRGLFHSAEECLEKALTLQADAPASIQADLYGLLGSIYKETYQHQKALSYLRQAITILENPSSAPLSTHEVHRLAKAYQEVGEIAAFRKHYDEAGQAFIKALEAAQHAQDAYRQAELYFRLAEIHDELGQSTDALHYYEKSYTLDRALENPLSCAATLANMGSLYLETGNLTKALESLTQSLAFDRLAKHREGQFKTLELLAMAYGQLKDWGQVEKRYEEALSLAQQENNALWQTTIYFRLGNLWAHQAQWSKALSCYQQADEIAPAELSQKSKALLHQHIEEVRQHV